MSLEKLAVIFVIIILPISVVLNTYIGAEVDTIKVQIEYDRKLYNATYDAIKAYQINSFNESTSDLANIKMRHINASANSFFNTLESSLNSGGYTKSEIKEFVPALVFTMYDGYYIYSKYRNTLTDDDYVSQAEANNYNQGKPDDQKIKPSTYQDYEDSKQYLYGVKPYIYYSCRYKYNGNDFVITYSLDNYITIQGMIGGNAVNDSGYVIDIENNDENSWNDTTHTVVYRNKTIGPESLDENLSEYIDGSDKLYKYHKVNGVKYYYDESQDNWFTLLNGKRIYTGDRLNANEDYSAYYYYRDAYQFTNRLISTYGLGTLTSNNAVVEEDDSRATEHFKEMQSNQTIFGNTSNIEEIGSNFYAHRMAVIRYAVERNLAIAISNYNDYGTSSSTNFQMPELKDDEWDKILNNMSVISFMQGFPIGNKIYNGCAVVANTKNSEVVTEGSIYIASGSNNKQGNYYSPLCTKTISNPRGVFNIDLEKRTYFDGINTSYYYPRFYFADYGSVVTSQNVANINSSYLEETNNKYNYGGNIYKYLDAKADPTIATAYYTALGRERFSTYKVNKNAEQVLSLYLVP